LRQVIPESPANKIQLKRRLNYDAVEGRLRNLKLDKLHDGIVQKGIFYVSCADFYDKEGKKIDVDFLVITDGDQLKTIQAVVHSVDGRKRQYHLES